MNKILLSVLVANYNNERYIAEAIKSIYSQQYITFNYEVIVCDDASTDKSLCVLEELKNQFNFCLLTNQSNRGVGYTKKKLVSESQGDYFIFLDSDDLLKENCLSVWEHFISSASENGPSMVYGNSFNLLPNGEIISWSRSKFFSGTILQNKFSYPVFHPIFYNRSKYDKTNGIDENLKSADDMDLWYKMEEVGDVVYIDQPIYVYRSNPNGVSQAKDNERKWLEVMIEHSFISVLAARRRGLDSREQVNDFAEVILRRVSKTVSKNSILTRIKRRVLTIIKNV